MGHTIDNRAPDKERRVELHTHSTYSDGLLSVPQIARLCHDTNVGSWALTDHDTVEGCYEAESFAQQYGYKFYPGIEISAFAGQSIHVLGYNIDPADTAMRRFSDTMKESRLRRMEKMIAKLQLNGINISLEAVWEQSNGGSIGRPHLARVMLKMGIVTTIQQAFDNYLAQGKSAYVATTWPTVEQAIEIIHSSGGIAILAHPAKYPLNKYLKQWVSAGLDGLEVRHPSHGLEDEQKLLHLANQYGLIKTASSDFHGVLRDTDSFIDVFGKVNFPEQWWNEFVSSSSK